METEIRENHGKIDEAFPQMGEPGVVLAIHAIAEIDIQQMTFRDRGFPPEKTGGGSDIATLLNQDATIERQQSHSPDEVSLLIDEIPSPIDHIGLGVAFREFFDAFQSPS